MREIAFIQMTLEIWGSILCFLAAGIVLITRQKSNKQEWALAILLSANAVLLGSDAVGYAAADSLTILNYVLERISNFLVYFSEDILMLFVTLFLYYGFEARGKKPNPIVLLINVIIVAINVVMLVVNIFYPFIYEFDENNYYVRNAGGNIPIVLGMLSMLSCMVIIIKYRKCLSTIERIAFLSYVILPFLSVGLQIIALGLSLMNIGITVSVLLMFTVYEIGKSRMLAKREIELAEAKVLLANQQKELADGRTKLLLSQIQPHFLYNSLGAIRRLIEKDPEEAIVCLDHFTGFLRGSVDMLNEAGTVSAVQELDFVENYLYLEKKRFGKKLTVQYEIKEKDFLIPPLTIQPLAENAVRHGIRKREDGAGTVIITTDKDESGYRIEIRDDGVGFVPEEKLEDGRSHVGLQNVIERIEKLCDGTVEIQSVINQGTTIVICLPIDE